MRLREAIDTLGRQFGDEAHRWNPATVRSNPERTPSPLGDGRTGDIELGGHGSCAHAVGEEQHDLGALDEFGRQGARAGDLFEVTALRVGQMNRLSFKGHIPRRQQPDGKCLSGTVH